MFIISPVAEATRIPYVIELTIYRILPLVQLEPAGISVTTL